MKKLKIGLSFWLVIVFCASTNSIVLLMNYLLALFLHELAHLFVAIKRGYTLNTIKLDMFGLSLDLDEPIMDKDNFAINIAGPMFNLFMCLVCLALYTIIPNSYVYLNTFCFSNLMLAIFNLMPVCPLDGGKIFRSLIKNKKTFKIVDNIIRCTLAIISIFLFINFRSLANSIMFLILAVFFLLSRNRSYSLTIFKFKQNKSFDKVVIFKTEENMNLFQMIKKIKTNNYTIFYIAKTHTYIDEDELISLATRLPLNTNCAELSSKIVKNS